MSFYPLSSHARVALRLDHELWSVLCHSASALQHLASAALVINAIVLSGAVPSADVTPIFFMWEKLVGTHYKPAYIRLPSRLPVGESHDHSILKDPHRCLPWRL